MADTTERKLPSLVADDLVDLSRRVAARRPLTHEYTGDALGPREEPTERGDGLAAAYPYAILELLVEIRDALVGDAIGKLAHVHVETRRAREDEERTIRLPLDDDGSIAVPIAAVIRDALYKDGTLDAGRITRIAPVLERELRVAISSRAVR